MNDYWITIFPWPIPLLINMFSVISKGGGGGTKACSTAYILGRILETSPTSFCTVTVNKNCSCLFRMMKNLCVFTGVVYFEGQWTHAFCYICLKL